MNLSWLHDFLTLAETGNFSRAADARHMTQPAFSRRIRALEDWLGVALFDRSSQPARLTATGEWFLGVAHDLLARAARIPADAQAVAESTSATLRLAATHALSFTFLPGWLRRLESHTTLGPVRLVSDVLQQCEALLQQGRVQFLLCHGHGAVPGALDAAGTAWLKVGTDALLPVTAPASTAAKSGKPLHTLDGKAARGAPLLEYSRESGIGRIVQAVHGAALQALDARPAVTAHLATVLKTMAIDGRGIAWLPATLVQDDLDAGRLVLAGGAAWHIALDIRLYRDAAAATATAQGFWRAADATAAG
jgi:DNA-binding transcriptional LysR family regulator